MQEIEVLISGRVQMVMYRDFAQRRARKLGIVGTVQNLADGTVKVVAQGDETALAPFVEYLRKGSVLARVDDVKIETRAPSGNFEDFTIVF